MRLASLSILLYLALSSPIVSSKVLNFLEDFGGIPFDQSEEICRYNSQLLSHVLRYNASNNTLLFPVNYTFHVVHGIYAKHVNNTVIQLDGTLRFERADLDIDKNHPFPSCIMIDQSDNVTITSKYRGLIDGRGPQWWGVPMVGYLQTAERRPRLFRFNQTSNLLIENIILQDSPYHTLYLDGVNNVEVRNISIVARRTYENRHTWIDLTAFNTDGIDVSGHNVWVHDVDIWVQDDCIAVKNNRVGDFSSSNLTFERVNASGLGFAIGSIGGSTAFNVTFRDSYLHRPVKGIYLKFARRNKFYRERNMTGLIENVLYHNITMEAPLQWPLWIGPAQQADSHNPCHPNPCSLCWPMSPTSKCHVVNKSKFRDITLRNVIINNPKMSPGVLLGNGGNEIENVVFDNVRVTKGAPVPMARYDLTETFPGLLQPIHDPYVPNANEGQENPDYNMLTSGFLPNEASTEEIMYYDYRVGERSNGVLQDPFVLIFAVLPSCFVFFVIYALRMRLEQNGSSVPTTAETRDNMKYPLLSKKVQSHPYKPGYLFAFLFLTFLFLYVLATSESWGPFRKPKWERTNRYYACRSVVHGIAKGNTWPIPHCFEKEGLPWYDSSMPSIRKTWVLAIASCILAICYVCLHSKRRTERSPARDQLPQLNAEQEKKNNDFQVMSISM